MKERAPPHSMSRNGRPASGAMIPSALNQVKDPQLRQSARSLLGLKKRVAVTMVTMSQNTPMDGVAVPRESETTRNAVKIVHTPASSITAQARKAREMMK